MRRSLTAAALAVLAGLGGAFGPAAAPAWSQDERFGGLPEGEHRRLVFGICSGCHSVKLVMQQGMSRAKWDTTLDWMTEKQGMPALEPETEEKVLDYLARHFGEDNRGSGQAAGAGGGLSPYNTTQPMTSPE